MRRNIVFISAIILLLTLLTFVWKNNSLLNEEFSNNHFNEVGNFLKKDKSVNNSDYSEGFWTNNIFKL